MRENACVCVCVRVCVCVCVQSSKAVCVVLTRLSMRHAATVQASLLAFSHLVFHLSIRPSLHPSDPVLLTSSPDHHSFIRRNAANTDWQEIKIMNLLLFFPFCLFFFHFVLFFSKSLRRVCTEEVPVGIRVYDEA